MNVHFSVTFSCVKNDRVYQLIVPLGAPYQDANEAGLELAQSVLDMQAHAIKQSEIDINAQKSESQDRCNTESE